MSQTKPIKLVKKKIVKHNTSTSSVNNNNKNVSLDVEQVEYCDNNVTDFCKHHNLKFNTTILLRNDKKINKFTDVSTLHFVDLLKKTKLKQPLLDCHIKCIHVTTYSNGLRTPHAVNLLIKKSKNYTNVKKSMINTTSSEALSEVGVESNTEMIEGVEYLKFGDVIDDTCGVVLAVLKGDNQLETTNFAHKEEPLIESEKLTVYDYLNMSLSDVTTEDVNRKNTNHFGSAKEIYIYFGTIIHKMVCYVFPDDYNKLSNDRMQNGYDGIIVDITHYNITVEKFKKALPTAELCDLDSIQIRLVPLLTNDPKYEENAHVVIQFDIEYDNFKK